MEFFSKVKPTTQTNHAYSPALPPDFTHPVTLKVEVDEEGPMTMVVSFKLQCKVCASSFSI
jgi:hypothetical protein